MRCDIGVPILFGLFASALFALYADVNLSSRFAPEFSALRNLNAIVAFWAFSG